ncbi:adenylyl-sulfate kinase [Nocardioides sp. zg-536]|uniref:Adenylyl-sulfate kinase n=1 Tax=Nocardioides faecalis TaxID=2803858 RepID=A0A938Y3B9_9ACTN|nr:adenylyl-sulfate kinase [Nocardioides faecalis]MBM9458377.1 adenylyl-sulfate kinase [Nocardioides faecalis]QVI58397.1 adenylyl-sulfate kinase [Nocardioides faecalis]
MSSPPVPQHCPSPRELDDLELLASGAAGPILGFDEPGSPITLDLPDTLRRHLEDGHEVELVDPEGMPLARVAKSPRGLSVTPLAHAQFGPFRSHYLSPDATRAAYPGRTVVPVSDLLTDAQLEQVRGLGPVLFAVLVGHGRPAVSPVALLRATLRVAEEIDAAVVAIPLADHGSASDAALRDAVLAAYAGTDRVVELTADGTTLPQLADIAAQEHPAPTEQGLALFFTGLSGSGKSTLARALIDRLLEQGTRSVTSLDGDVVRRNLSAGLGFSREDRETNIRRIGWVAAEIARHGGVAVCSPIAPYDETRQQVRAMVEAAGGAFFLIHVATPVAECERRDRKGLYAKARRGEIPEFTGISSPYEEPTDADVRVDTTARSIEEALADVTDALRTAGYLDLPRQGAPGPAPLSRPIETQPVEPRPAETTLRVLFVCTANICRSPYMELRARSLAGDAAKVSFTSAGTHGFTAHPVDATMGQVLRERGVGGELIEGFASRSVTRELIAGADLVLTAEASHRAYVLEEAPQSFRKVFTLGQFAASAARVDDALTGRRLVEAAGHRRAGAAPEHDVRDPYRRGKAAAEASADQIDRLLGEVLPRLGGLAGSERAPEAHSHG